MAGVGSLLAGVVVAGGAGGVAGWVSSDGEGGYEEEEKREKKWRERKEKEKKKKGRESDRDGDGRELNGGWCRPRGRSGLQLVGEKKGKKERKERLEK